MLPDALKFDHYGSLEDIRFLLEHALSASEGRSAEEISRFCEEKSVILSSSLSAILSLSEYLVLVRREASNKFILCESDIGDTEIFAKSLAEKIFSNLISDGVLSAFIMPEAIEYDAEGDSICIRNNLVPLDYSGLKNLLISLGFFEPHSFSGNLLVVAKELEPFFETRLVPGIKEEKFPEERLKGLSLATLMRMQEMNALHGREAEAFVLGYERRRLAGPIAERVRIISDLQCDAGYDIASFDTGMSSRPDRFIEVKSFARELSFFWSSNEVAVSETRKEQYFLYLVDRGHMFDEGYVPVMIKNPHQNVFLNHDEWLREPMSWFFSKEN